MIYYGNNTYQYQIGDHTIEFTSIPAEFSERVTASILESDNTYFLEFLFNKITKNKYDIEQFEAGIIINVIFSALKISGTIKEPSDIPDKIEKFREISNNSLYTSLFSSIIKVMPTYKLEELRTKTTDEVIELLVFAEKLIGKEIYDLAKLRQSFEVPTEKTTKSSLKGAKAISQEDLAYLQNFLNSEEREGPFF